MPFTTILANDRQARETAALIEKISYALSSEQVLKSVVQGLPPVLIQGVQRSLEAERKELSEVLSAYQDAKDGKPERLQARAGSDPGALLVVARVARGWSQKELARRLFLPEQQIQR